MVCVLGCRLRVEVEITSTGEWLWAEYDHVTVESETDNYTLHVAEYHGNAGDAFNYEYPDFQSNGMPFSTPDRDNDQWAAGSCAGSRGSGWWFRHCSISMLNGMVERYWHVTTSMQWRQVSANRMMLQCAP